MRAGEVVYSAHPDAIQVGARMRPLDRGAVEAIKASYLRIGQQTPIQIRVVSDEEAWLVTGLHRLTAARELGWAEILFTEASTSETEQRLWEISENLHRAELTVQERAEHVAEWIRLTDLSYQVDTKGQSGHRPRGGTNEAARQLGLDKFEAHRAVKIASIAAGAKEAARDAGLGDNQSALLRVAAEPTLERQVEKVAEIAAAKAKPKTDAERDHRALDALRRAWAAASETVREKFLDEVTS